MLLDRRSVNACSGRDEEREEMGGKERRGEGRREEEREGEKRGGKEKRGEGRREEERKERRG